MVVVRQIFLTLFQISYNFIFPGRFFPAGRIDNPSLQVSIWICTTHPRENEWKSLQGFQTDQVIDLLGLAWQMAVQFKWNFKTHVENSLDILEESQKHPRTNTDQNACPDSDRSPSPEHQDRRLIQGEFYPSLPVSMSAFPIWYRPFSVDRYDQWKLLKPTDDGKRLGTDRFKGWGILKDWFSLQSDL